MQILETLPPHHQSKRRLKRWYGQLDGGLIPVMDLPTGKNNHTTRDWILRTLLYQLEQCPIYQAPREGWRGTED